MKNCYKYLLVFVVSIFVTGLFFAFRCLQISRITFESENICQNDELIAKLIVNNINPFSKFKYLKKRNTDCKVTLITNKNEALSIQPLSFCHAIDASTNSITMLVNAYVHDMYDRETASKELLMMVNLMTPYNYCDEYIDNIVTLVQLKKRYGL